MADAPGAEAKACRPGILSSAAPRGLGACSHIHARSISAPPGRLTIGAGHILAPDAVALVPGHLAAEANAYSDVALATGLDHGRNVLVAHADALVAIGGGAGTLSEIPLAWVHGRLVIAFRLPGWSGRLADAPLDDRRRFAEVTDDRVFGVDTAEDVLDVLAARLHRYLNSA